METQAAYSHGYGQEEHDPNIVGHHQHHGEDEDDHHHEKKSVLKKVKAKAKKIKDTIKKHGHGHNHDHEHDHGYEYPGGHIPDDHDLDEEDDDEEEMDPEVHGAPMYESAAVKSVVSVQPEALSGPGITYERLKARRPDPVAPIESDDTFPSGDYKIIGNQGANIPVSGLGPIETEQSTVNFGKTTAFEEPPAPQNTPVPTSCHQSNDANPAKTYVHGQEEYSGQTKVNLRTPKGLEEDPAAPRDTPDAYTTTNYQTKVTDPTGKGGEATGITPVLHSLDKMNIYDTQDTGREQNIPPGTHKASEQSFPMGSHDQFSSEPTSLGTHKATEQLFPTGSHDQFSPEPTPPIRTETPENQPLVSETMETTNPQEQNIVSEKPSNQSSYTEKISSATSAITDKAVSAKNVVASKLGYGEKDQSTINEPKEGQDATKQSSAKKMAATVTGKLTPAYEKVVEAGSSVISKFHGPGTGTAREVGTGTASEVGTETQVQQQDKVVAMKGYIAAKLKPSEEDKLLSEVISDALKKRNDYKDSEDGTKAKGKVTESEEVERRLGTGDQRDEKASPGSGSVNSPTTSVVEKLRGTVGSWFGKGTEESQGNQKAHDSSYNGNEGFSSTSAGERRLQETSN